MPLIAGSHKGIIAPLKCHQHSADDLAVSGDRAKLGLYAGLVLAACAPAGEDADQESWMGIGVDAARVVTIDDYQKSSNADNMD